MKNLIIKKQKNIKKRDYSNRNILKLMAVLFFIPVFVCSGMTFCTLMSGTVTTDSIVSVIVNVVLDVFRLIGVVLVVAGIGSAVVAFKDDNSHGQTQGIRLAIIGAILVGLKALLKKFGLI